jgi:hypothetical protein
MDVSANIASIQVDVVMPVECIITASISTSITLATLERYDFDAFKFALFSFHFSA